MDDLISRQALMKEFSDFVRASNNSDFARTPTWNDAVSLVESMPSVQSERDNGEWIYGEDKYGIDGYHCDKCGFFVLWDYAHTFINYIKDYNFCPNCGARMGGVNDGRMENAC